MTEAATSMDSLLDAVGEIGPIIREHSDEAERECRMSPKAIEVLADAGLLRMYTPRSLSGLEVEPLICLRVIEEISKYDSAAGWTLMVANAAFFLGSRLPDEGAEEIFGQNPDVIVAATFGKPMSAVPVDGGYRISGRSPFASNCRDSRWCGFSAVLMIGDQPRMTEGGAPEQIFAYIPTEDCEIVDNWSVVGMRGTGSDDVALDDVFVPAHRTFPLTPEFEPGSHYQGPLYKLPLYILAVTLVPPVALAIARQAIQEVVAVAKDKTPFATSAKLRHRVTAQVKLGQAEGSLRSARALLIATTEEAWQRVLAGEKATLEQKADLLLAATQAMHGSMAAVEFMWRTAGTTGIYKRSPLERYFRDMQVLVQHGFVSESRYATVGQIYLGLEPDFPLVTF